MREDRVGLSTVDALASGVEEEESTIRMRV